ncbi:MAG TPA: alpha/beta hydrolase [Steroidobacteraceae bacterium]|nr:alpha/beta hydrolase [Steroidobacteraceae bacterium]
MARPRARVRISKARAAGFLALLVALLLIGAALLEQFLEKRDFARLAASETFAQLGESRVRYRLLGADKPGPTVVLLHGMLASAEQWEGFQRELSAKHPVLAYDRGGSGFSESSSAHSGVDQARELAQLLDALNIKRPVIVVGYSISSMEARLFADQFPEKTAGLVLFDPYLPERDSVLGDEVPSIHRSYVRTFSSGCLTALFGIRRFMGSLESQKPSTLQEQRSSALLWSFHFWWAEARDWWAAQDTQRLVVESRAPLPPLLYLSNPIADTDPVRPLIFQFVARSPHGEVRFFPHEVDHSSLLTSAETRLILATAIDDLSGQAVQTGASSESSSQPPGQ